jgi:hypothetical protein
MNEYKVKYTHKETGLNNTRIIKASNEKEAEQIFVNTYPYLIIRSIELD